MKDTIGFIREEVYVHKNLKPICEKSILKKLQAHNGMYSTQRNVHNGMYSSATGKLWKKVDGISVGGTPSVITLSDCFMNKIERYVVMPLKPKFYRRLIDDTYRRRKKNEPDEVFFKNELLPSKHKGNNWV